MKMIGLSAVVSAFAPDALSPCGPFVASQEFGEDSDLGYDDSVLYSDSSLYSNTSVVTAYNCLCGNANTEFMMPCTMGNVCDQDNGFCFAMCSLDQKAKEYCGCSRKSPNSSEHADGTWINCNRDQTCVGLGVNVTNSGVCINECDGPLSEKTTCACYDGETVTYCSEKGSICDKGTCFLQCNGIESDCVCGTSVCLDICKDSKCLPTCESNIEIQSECFCDNDSCEQSKVCTSKSICVDKCKENSESAEDCWCGVVNQICSQNQRCYEGQCISDCGLGDAIISGGMCSCSNQICDINNPYCVNSQCLGSCPQGIVTESCKCNGVALCVSGYSCERSGSCVPPAPTSLPTSVPTIAPSCVAEWGTCGGLNNLPERSCCESFECVPNQASYTQSEQIYYKQCLRMVLSSNVVSSDTTSSKRNGNMIGVNGNVQIGVSSILIMSMLMMQ